MELMRLQHPWGEEIPITITEAWIQDEEGAFEYTPDVDKDGNIIQSEYGVKLQEGDGYHLRAKKDWTKVPEGSATLNYSYAFFNDAGEASYSGQNSVPSAMTIPTDLKMEGKSCSRGNLRILTRPCIIPDMM